MSARITMLAADLQNPEQFVNSLVGDVFVPQGFSRPDPAKNKKELKRNALLFAGTVIAIRIAASVATWFRSRDST